jgi:hypothetical protein
MSISSSILPNVAEAELAVGVELELSTPAAVTVVSPVLVDSGGVQVPSMFSCTPAHA